MTGVDLILESSLPNSAVQTWRGQGKKVVGTICCYAPEELIDAAGLLPYRIRATGCPEDIQGEALMSAYSCSWARSCLELLMNGTYGFIDGIITSDGCLQSQRIFDNWRYYTKPEFFHLVTAPRKFTEPAIEWYREELVKMKEMLEKLAGKSITDTAITKSIRTYNETRSLIRELYELRREQFPVITGTETQRLILAAMSMPKKLYNQYLIQYLNKVKDNQPITDYNARLMIIGNGIDNPEFIKIIEDNGGLVVCDTHCFGSRYLWEPVETEGDALTSLAESYLRRPTCPRMMDGHQPLFDLTKDMAEQYKADGIIYTKMRSCDLWGGENLFLEKRFKTLDIPVLSLEREEIINNEGQIAVRVEAFIEMLQGGKF